MPRFVLVGINVFISIIELTEVIFVCSCFLLFELSGLLFRHWFWFYHNVSFWHHDVILRSGDVIFWFDDVIIRLQCFWSVDMDLNVNEGFLHRFAHPLIVLLQGSVRLRHGVLVTDLHDNGFNHFRFRVFLHDFVFGRFVSLVRHNSVHLSCCFNQLFICIASHFQRLFNSLILSLVRYKIFMCFLRFFIRLGFFSCFQHRSFVKREIILNLAWFFFCFALRSNLLFLRFFWCFIFVSLKSSSLHLFHIIRDPCHIFTLLTFFRDFFFLCMMFCRFLDGFITLHIFLVCVIHKVSRQFVERGLPRSLPVFLYQRLFLLHIQRPLHSLLLNISLHIFWIVLCIRGRAIVFQTFRFFLQVFLFVFICFFRLWSAEILCDIDLLFWFCFSDYFLSGILEVLHLFICVFIFSLICSLINVLNIRRNIFKLIVSDVFINSIYILIGFNGYTFTGRHFLIGQWFSGKISLLIGRDIGRPDHVLRVEFDWLSSVLQSLVLE